MRHAVGRALHTETTTESLSPCSLSYMFVDNLPFDVDKDRRFPTMLFLPLMKCRSRHTVPAPGATLCYKKKEGLRPLHWMRRLDKGTRVNDNG